MTRLLSALFLSLSIALPAAGETEQAVFAGGCFWCMESDYQDLDGVVDVISGFTGGELPNPTYNGNHEGHYEAIQVTYDPEKVSYQALLDHYWVNIDPFDDRGQFCDKGFSYRAAIFVDGDEQQALAEASRDAVVARFPDQQVVTQVLPASAFWPVEEYHQDYALKNPVRYKFYRWNCGRDQRLEEIWGKAPH
jgi:peptide-methionine (S)-S-oxide reductase